MKTVFYRAEQLSALERKSRIWDAVCALVCAATAGAVAFCALRRTTLNAVRMEYCATAALVLGGWIVITIRVCALRYTRAMHDHIARILAAEDGGRELRGRVTLEKKRAAISGSIEVRGLRVETAEGRVRLLIAESFSGQLEAAAAQGELRVRAVEGYVTEVER